MTTRAMRLTLLLACGCLASLLLGGLAARLEYWHQPPQFRCTDPMPIRLEAAPVPGLPLTTTFWA